MSYHRELLTIILVSVFAFSSFAQENIDYKMIDTIRDEGFNRSQVMELASFMADVYGPRFSNSPGYNKAAQWAVRKFKEFGIEAKLDSYGEVGIGWENKFTSVHMHEPQYMTLTAYPMPYSRGTNGKVISNVVHINSEEIYSEQDLEKYSREVNGKIVFIAPLRVLTLNFQPAAVRLSEEELEDMAELKIIPEERMSRGAYGGRRERGTSKRPLSKTAIRDFLEKRGALVVVEPGGPQGSAPMDKGIVLVNSGRPIDKSAHKPMPHLIVAAEHYNRIVRILEKDINVKMEVEVRVKYDEEDLQDYNVIAEIPGTDLKDEIVMIGGHYDGESAATGASDNASGCASVMEAMRILKTIGVQPRRTIRAALWGCEEAGHLGSKAYVKKHFGDPETNEYLPEYDKLSVYFNMDWYGRFRGIFLQGNDLVRPIFEAWMKPFHDVGMSWIVPGNTGGTDHMQFVRIGLPGFQFIQDDLEFFTTTFHTNADFYDRLVAEDLMQASVILASFAYNAAMRDEMIPRSKNQVKNNRRWHK